MSFVHGSKAVLYTMGMNATPYINDISMDGSVETAEVTVLGNTGKSYIPGLQDASLKLSGFFDGNVATDTNTFSYTVNSYAVGPAQAQPCVIYLPQGDGNNSLGYGFQGVLGKDSVKTPVNAAGTVDVDITSSSGWEGGYVTAPLTARTTASGTTAVIDNLVSSANGASAFLVCTAVVGSAAPTMTLTIQHSADNVTYVPLMVFVAQTTLGDQRISVPAGTTVNRYIRGSWAITGTTPSFTFATLVSRK
jgi:hypothetical protein